MHIYINQYLLSHVRERRYLDNMHSLIFRKANDVISRSLDNDVEHKQSIN